ncbi:flagellar hook-associated protein FlgK, partial [Phenylobacterium sp.]|uniref:flagellar hook-associated protein FlgK n=1 Tax=Phenylobacterium sp. TaxID=1871053 RepID=UPI002E2F266C
LHIALNTATSGLMAAQTGIRTVSDNIANVNTPGYVRKAMVQESQVISGAGMGVTVTGIKRVTDQYLQLASLTAGSDAAKWNVVSEYLDSAQSLFGDPSSPGYFFSRLDEVWNAFAQAADDPSSSLLRSQALTRVQDFLTEADRINGSLQNLAKTVDARLVAGVDRANALIGEIQKLNVDITRTKMAGGDASGSENIQATLVDELAGIMNVRVAKRDAGGVVIRSAEGMTLAGDHSSKLVYERTDSTRGYIAIQNPNNPAYTTPIQVSGGELRGLLDMRDEVLPDMTDQLGEFVSRAAEQINRVHNDSAAVPAPTTLAGRNTGLLDIASAASGFTGTSSLAVVDAAGVVQRRIDINFTAGTMTVDGAPGPAFTPGSFVAALNTALGGDGTASYVNGALSISAANPGEGLAIDEGTSSKNGRGFSHYFGLNDLVRSDGLSSWDTGLTGASAHGFTGSITFRMAEGDGRFIRDITVPAPAGATMNDLLTALNSPATGVGLYGQFTLDANGALTFGSGPPLNANMSVVTDTTQRGAGGPTMSDLFGLGVLQRSSRAGRFNIDSAIYNDPRKLGFAQLDLSVAAGQPALRPGDNKGALALAEAGELTGRFGAAGDAPAADMTLTRYAMEFAGGIGRKSAAAESSMTGAQAVRVEADARRLSVEGVNMDEELVMLTTYQQAFNASARMIQAAKDLFDVLLEFV